MWLILTSLALGQDSARASVIGGPLGTTSFDVDYLTVPSNFQLGVVELTYWLCGDPAQRKSTAETYTVEVVGGQGSSLLYERGNFADAGLLWDDPFGWTSCTEDIVEFIDLTGVKYSNEELSLELSLTENDPAWDALPPILTATLEVPAELEVLDVRSEDAWVTNNRGGSRMEFWSLPDEGATNTTTRTLTVEAAVDNVALTGVTVTYEGDGTMLYQELDPTSDPRVDDQGVVDGVQTLVLDVSHIAPTPASNLSRAAWDHYSYRVELIAEDIDGHEVRNALTGEARAYWDATTILPDRYGLREADGDAWGTTQTLAWVQANAGVLEPVNDIAGEHNRDLNHATHDCGCAVDLYYPSPFYTPQGVSGDGGTNRDRLKETAADAAAGDQAALDRMRDFVLAARGRLDAMEADASVEDIIFGTGPKTGSLAASWMRTLLQDGTLGSQAVVTTTWPKPDKLDYAADHNDHWHVALHE